MAAAVEKIEKKSVGETLNNFIHKNRKSLFIGLIAIAVLLIGFAVYITVMEKVRAQALSGAEEFKRRYEALRVFINSDDPEAASKLEEISALEAELAVFEEKNSGYAQAMAWAISAGIQGDRKNWGEAEKAWIRAAEAGGKSYFAPAALCNAGAAAENNGDNEGALEHYGRALELGDIFPEAPRAQFAVGRIQEIQGNKEAALEAYRTLAGKWPGDQIWAKLAQSRILTLSGN
jgi:tetratricopeptide (TPR) repeat protein